MSRWIYPLIGLLLALAAASPVLAEPALADSLPPGVTIRKDVAYGADDDQRMDIYLPANARNAPILLMAHGGGWKRGDKEMGRVVTNKVARWAPKGVIVASVNYRMIPDLPPSGQVEDVARALAKLQEMAPELGGDPANVILMGHSAGGHLVSLLNAAPEIGTAQGAKPWKGAVSLDSGALNVPAIMEKRHFKLYDEAFGTDPAEWNRASPYHRLAGATPPILFVCREGKYPCREAGAYSAKAKGFGNSVEILPQDKSHGEINWELGEPGPYTDAVEAFMRKLGWGV
ncbi:alpha/beta hydrolase [Dongia sp.]|uniref:alpha/beta hydrolase n=1 Tax=Dongia sp. TaxID=1977262 RepID=UPI0035AFD8BF